ARPERQGRGRDRRARRRGLLDDRQHPHEVASRRYSPPPASRIRPAHLAHTRPSMIILTEPSARSAQPPGSCSHESDSQLHRIAGHCLGSAWLIGTPPTMILTFSGSTPTNSTFCPGRISVSHRSQVSNGSPFCRLPGAGAETRLGARVRLVRQALARVRSRAFLPLVVACVAPARFRLRYPRSTSESTQAPLTPRLRSSSRRASPPLIPT